MAQIGEQPGARDNNGQVSLEEELLGIIADQVKVTPYTIILSMGIVAYMMYRHIPDMPLVWGGWLLAVVLTQLYRIYRLPKLPGESHRPAVQRTREAARINSIGIFIQSLSLLAFPMFTPFEASVQTMMFIGMGVGSIVTAVGWAPYTLTHIFVTLLPMFGFWLWSGLYGPAGGLGVLVFAVGLPYSLTMWSISRRLYRMNEEFFANRAALAVALEETERASAAKTRFLAAASHDLRQPIHTLSLFSAALGMRTLDERVRHIADNIDGAVKALSSQLDALLDVSKLDAGIVPVNASALQLDKLLARLYEEYRASARAEGIALSWDCPQQAVTWTDPSLLERILRNILTNAITHNTDCELSMEVWRGENCWVLQLSDTGVGIPAEEQEHIFEEFYQVSNPERDRSKGLGLGLSIVKRLSSLLELDMRFQSQPGSGTAFRFYLPEHTGDGRLSQPVADSSTELQGIRVLVLDDETAIREGMKVLLEQEGCQVDLADSIPAARELAGAQAPDILLVDYRLPGNDSGLDAIRALREQQPQLPAIVISGDTGPDRLQEVQAAGLQLLSKPVARERLLASIAGAVDR